MNRLSSAFASATLGVLIVSCSGETVDYSEPAVVNPKPSEPTEPAEPTVDLSSELPEVTLPTMAAAPLSTIPSEAVAGFNDFSWKFYLANSAQSHGNVCVSPFSVGAVLGMIANGDDGAARNEILKMLGFEESDAGLTVLNAYYQTLLSNIPNLEEGISCDVTNTLWCDPLTYRIRKSFMDAITDSYYAYGIGISPSGSSGQKAINGFVEKNTNGLIKDFLKEPLDVSLAFLNTLYFKAGWTQCFEKDYTSKDWFVDIDGQEKEVDFMWGFDIAQYAKTEDGTQAIRLNYGDRLNFGESAPFSMTCILPSSEINHIALDEVLTEDNIKNINKNMKYRPTIVKLPKFEIESNNPHTIDILRDLGLENVCSRLSSFGRIAASGEFFLTCFIHATKLKVDEDGTEGAAASFGEMNSGGPHGEIPVVFNRPFIFYIQENTTGAILFIGSVKTFS